MEIININEVNACVKKKMLSAEENKTRLNNEIMRKEKWMGKKLNWEMWEGNGKKDKYCRYKYVNQQFIFLFGTSSQFFVVIHSSRLEVFMDFLFRCFTYR